MLSVVETVILVESVFTVYKYIKEIYKKHFSSEENKKDGKNTQTSLDLN